MAGSDLTDRDEPLRGSSLSAEQSATLLSLSWPRRNRLTPYAFLAPTFAALALIYFYPMSEAVRLSFRSSGLGVQQGDFVGISNYLKAVDSRYFADIVTVSAIYTAGNVVFVCVIGLLTALMLHRSFPGRAFARSLVILPWAIPYVAAALIWSWMFDFEFGILNFLVQQLAFVDDKVAFLTSNPEALTSVTGVSVWKLFPLGTVMFLAGLQTIPEEHYEAAVMDGANRIQCLWHITLPGLRQISVFLSLLIIVWSFGRSFTVIFILTGGGPARGTETVVIRTYLEAFKFFRLGDAAALGVIVLLISLVFSIIYLRVLYRSEVDS